MVMPTTAEVTTGVVTVAEWGLVESVGLDTVAVSVTFVPLACTEPVGNYPMGGIFTPFERDPVLICPGANGGSEWTDQSFNPQTNLMYVCGIHQPQIWTAKPEKLEQGTLRAVKVNELHVERKIRLVYPARRALSHAAKAFLEVIQQPK